MARCLCPRSLFVFPLVCGLLLTIQGLVEISAVKVTSGAGDEGKSHNSSSNRSLTRNGESLEEDAASQQQQLQQSSEQDHEEQNSATEVAATTEVEEEDFSSATLPAASAQDEAGGSTERLSPPPSPENFSAAELTSASEVTDDEISTGNKDGTWNETVAEGDAENGPEAGFDLGAEDARITRGEADGDAGDESGDEDEAFTEVASSAVGVQPHLSGKDGAASDIEDPGSSVSNGEKTVSFAGLTSTSTRRGGGNKGSSRRKRATRQWVDAYKGKKHTISCGDNAFVYIDKAMWGFQTKAFRSSGGCKNQVNKTAELRAFCRNKRSCTFIPDTKGGGIHVNFGTYCKERMTHVKYWKKCVTPCTSSVDCGKGKCRGLTESKYLCQCPLGTYLAEDGVCYTDPCASFPCGNGICTRKDNSQGYTCSCSKRLHFLEGACRKEAMQSITDLKAHINKKTTVGCKADEKIVVEEAIWSVKEAECTQKRDVRGYLEKKCQNHNKCTFIPYGKLTSKKDYLYLGSLCSGKHGTLHYTISCYKK